MKTKSDAAWIAAIDEAAKPGLGGGLFGLAASCPDARRRGFEVGDVEIE